MIQISFLTGQLLLVCGWILFRLIVWARAKRISWKHEAVQLLFLINLLVIYRMTFHPFAKADGKVQPLLFDPATVWPFRVNLIPFVNLLDYDSKRDLLLNIIGNSTMFIPTGIMTPLIYKKTDGLRSVVLTGFLISLTIEILQLPFAVRASDVDDLILNTVGCLAGFGILCFVRWARRKAKKEPSA